MCDMILPFGLGSSPLTRGKRISMWVSLCVCGLIPAHAGKTFAAVDAITRARAHPRSRGENTQHIPRPTPNSGSSPLTRGKLASAHVRQVIVGLIPAHAGKTKGSPTRPSRAGAHPRSRGENWKRPRASVRWMGSSPLTRGKRAGRVGGRAGFGLIPAHAGKTVEEDTWATAERAHPRSRGENH